MVFWELLPEGGGGGQTSRLSSKVRRRDRAVAAAGRLEEGEEHLSQAWLQQH